LLAKAEETLLSSVSPCRGLSFLHFISRLHQDGLNTLVRPCFVASGLQQSHSNAPTGPNGQPYYYNATNHESTYIRPVPPIQPQTPAKKKEKPALKTLIPGTDWLRVTTTEGNIFYSHKIKKESVWVVPDELKDALEAFQAQEEQQASSAKATKAPKSSEAKRKAEEPVPVDEIVVSKKARVEDEPEEDDVEDSESEEEEEWQREAAEQLAAEAEEERKRVEEEEKREVEMETKRARAAAEIVMPQRVDLSIEEGKALFKVCVYCPRTQTHLTQIHPDAT